MFEKVSQAAEKAATNVSRRRFLGRIGRGAGVAAAAFAGLLVHASPAWAGKRTKMCHELSTLTVPTENSIRACIAGYSPFEIPGSPV